VRIEFFDLQVESIRAFNPASQRSTRKLDSFRLLPARELPLDSRSVEAFRERFRRRFPNNPARAEIYRRLSEGAAMQGAENYLPLFYERTDTLWDYLPSGSAAILLPGSAAAMQAPDVVAAYPLATAWAGWIQAHADDWNAVGDLARVKPIMARVAELDGGYDHGGPHLYMGVFETLLPPSVGGRPELGRDHFEQVIELTGGRHLLAKVMFAESYARLVFDRELHDALLTDVLAAEPGMAGLTLMNTIAKEQAQALLESADDYF